VRAKVSSEDAPRYRGRKEYPTQNILAACSFDLKFTYILPGWEVFWIIPSLVLSYLRNF
jgi:hypothetical protein